MEAKVARKLRALLRVTGTTWGRSLHDMRELYRTTIIPIITYGCGAWYVDATNEPNRGNLPKYLLQRLENLQYSCLMQISGAFHRTAAKILEKELFIEPLVVTLARLSIAHRVRSYYDDDSVHSRLAREERHSKEEVKTHPYQILDREACSVERASLAFLRQRKTAEQADKDWTNRNKRRKAINVYLEQWAFFQSAYIWNEYRNSRLLRGGKVCPALDSDFYAEWDERSLECYQGLTRAQSTMLLHIRTSFIGLNAHLHSIKCSETAYCPCLRDRHTAKHLLLDCSLLSEQRGALVKAIGHLSFQDMLTKDAFETTRWAVMHSGMAPWHLAKSDAQSWISTKRKKKGRRQQGGRT
ncbi:hypothetical protein GT037_004134 [Alternaria burnsii]|uniref:Uncharacterized protein n=1 Tax=Alternaria burnsii TaxID=1187904 RepID=A0A8H7BCH5_9PLEO|nr:uncharacterized protein GT037_004134 [Alternaria burnsii]KAF7678753.1 hypothetical protein GT037_004134 [Alternaria burnsii]